MTLARFLCDSAARLLPADQAAWGKAMRAELAYIAPGRDALVHGIGCVLTAARVRSRDVETGFAVGRWALALFGAAFACWYFACALHGVAVLRGTSDGFLDTLIRDRAGAELIARYKAARPVVVACLFALGSAHLIAAWLIVRGDIGRFVIAWTVAAVMAVVTVAVQLRVVWRVDAPPSELVAVLVQASALTLLLLWADNRNARRRPG